MKKKLDKLKRTISCRIKEKLDQLIIKLYTGHIFIITQ
jgi:hypothetical protein